MLYRFNNWWSSTRGLWKNTCYVSYFTTLTTGEVVHVVYEKTRFMFHALPL